MAMKLDDFADILNRVRARFAADQLRRKLELALARPQRLPPIMAPMPRGVAPARPAAAANLLSGLTSFSRLPQ